MALGSNFRGTAVGLTAAVAAAGLSLAVAPAWAAKRDAAFTIANYPVDATETNAVAAKEKALADGQEAAFRSLLKRIVPVTAYRKIKSLDQIRAGELVSGVSVRSERNSSTQYIASLDFTYQADAVRGLLQSHGIPFVETQAPAVTLIPIIKPNAGAPFAADTGDWQTAWKGLDLEHTLTPLKLETLKPAIHADTIGMLANGDDNGLRILAGEYGSETIILAIAEPDPAAKKLHVTLAGQDASGFISLKRSYRIPDGDAAYASEFAAIVSLGILEGRWKALKSPSGTGATAAVVPAEGAAPVWSAQTAAEGGEQVRLTAEFSSLSQWNEMRTQLLDTPGVENMEIATVSARSADLMLHYPGGVRALANALGNRGLKLLDTGAGWTLAPTY